MMPHPDLLEMEAHLLSCSCEFAPPGFVLPLLFLIGAYHITQSFFDVSARILVFGNPFLSAYKQFARSILGSGWLDARFGSFQLAQEHI
jgi:hypothetical protein